MIKMTNAQGDHASPILKDWELKKPAPARKAIRIGMSKMTNAVTSTNQILSVTKPKAAPLMKIHRPQDMAAASVVKNPMSVH